MHTSSEDVCAWLLYEYFEQHHSAMLASEMHCTHVQVILINSQCHDLEITLFGSAYDYCLDAIYKSGTHNEKERPTTIT